MHGLIFTSFRAFTRMRLPDHADAIWDGAPPFDETDAYPDEEFERLVDRAALEAGESRRAILLDFGRYTATTSFRLLRPEFYEDVAGTRQFLLRVERHIHEELRASIPGAAPPRLQVRPFGADGVSIAYISERKLCELLEGLVLGTGEFYGEELVVEQSTCMHRGDDACSFFVTPVETKKPAL
jgi:predicted hydrocarbon binding protein